jgi:tetratricopeptide (TPR) repeat protein
MPTRWIAVVALVVLTLAVYAPVQNHEFIELDDPNYITENVHVKAGLSYDGARWALTTTHFFNWHPLTWLSHMTDVELFGIRAGPYLLVNLSLHVTNTLLLLYAMASMTGAFWRPVLVAALFALHPLHVESVAWVAERKDVLSTLFGLLAIWAYARYAERPAMARYLAVLCLLALSLMAKPMFVTLPFLLLLLDFWPLQRAQWPLGRLFLEKLPLLALVVLSCGMTVYAQVAGGSLPSFEQIPLAERITNALISYASYLIKTLWPHPLVVYYPHPLALRLPQALGSSLLLLTISAWVIRGRARRPYAVTAWFWYVGTLLPVIGLVQVGYQAMADRYTYVPLIGVFIGLAWGAAELFERARVGRVVAPVLACLVFAALTLMTWRQVAYWKDTNTLFEHTLRHTSENFVAHSMLGKHLLRQGRWPEATHQLSRALAIEPNQADAHADLGAALKGQGKAAQAIPHYLRSLELRPDHAVTHANLGLALAARGKLDRAVHHHREALRLRPDLADAHNNLGTALFAQGQIDEAASHYREALRLQPDLVFAHFNLGLALWARGNVTGALKQLREALRLAPNLAPAHKYLGLLLVQQRRAGEALPHLERALGADPDDADLQQVLRDAQSQRTY